MPFDEAPPHAHQQSMVLSDLDCRNDQDETLRQTRYFSALSDGAIAQAGAEVQNFNTRQWPSRLRGQFDQHVARILRYVEQDIRVGNSFLDPFSELSNVPLLDKGFVLQRNEIGNQHRKLDAVAPLGGGDMLHIARKPPGRTERDDGIVGPNQSLETASSQRHVDKIV